jgi:hypothetical protein
VSRKTVDYDFPTSTESPHHPTRRLFTVIEQDHAMPEQQPSDDLTYVQRQARAAGGYTSRQDAEAGRQEHDVDTHIAKLRRTPTNVLGPMRSNVHRQIRRNPS